VEEISHKELAKLPSQHAIVVVNFWATWCGPCVVEIPHLNRLQQERPDVRIYGVSIDDAVLGREVFKFVDRHRIRYPVYVKERRSSEDPGQEWYENVDAIPITYVFKNGTLHNTILGAVQKDQELTDAIDGPSNEEDIAQAGWDSDEDAYSDEKED